jgi:hypothetical protein
VRPDWGFQQANFNPHVTDFPELCKTTDICTQLIVYLFQSVQLRRLY